MSNEWKMVKIGDVCTKASSNISLNKVSDNIGEYALFGASGFTKNIDFYHQEKEYIAIVKDGAGVGRVMMLPAKSSIVGTMQYILPKSNIAISYLCYFLKQIDLAKYASGATIPHIYFKDYSKEEILLPSIEKQIEIVAVLDNASELVEKRKAQLAELDHLAESIFYDMFGDPVTNEKGWERGQLGDVCKSVNYGTSSPANCNGRYKYLRMGNITYGGELDFSDIKHIDVSEKDYEKYVVRKGDILFNRTNSKELVGKTAYFNIDEEMIIAGYIIRVRVTNSCLPVFVSKYLNTKYIKVHLRDLCKSIIGQANINAKELQSIPIYFPPIELQQQFAERIEKIEEQKTKVQTALKESEDLFQRLMQDMFKPGNDNS